MKVGDRIQHRNGLGSPSEILFIYPNGWLYVRRLRDGYEYDITRPEYYKVVRK